MLRFENGFDIRDLHHFASKNVPHTKSQIPGVTEIQQFWSNQLMLKIVIFKNFKFAPIQNSFEIRDLHHFARKNVPHTTSQILRVTEIQQFRSNQLMLKIVIFKNFKFAPIQNGFEIRDLHYFASKNVPHTISQILRVTEIQQFRSNQLMLKIVIFKYFKFAPIQNGFEIRNLHHFARKNVPHTTSQILRVTEIQQFRSNQLMLKNRYF